MDLAVADHDLAARRVDQQLADPDRAVSAAVAATQDRLDARPQLVIRERLADALIVSPPI
jgi:hypothetical protein